MPILMPEKIVIASLVSGLATVKTDLATYLADVFDTVQVGADYVTKISGFLAATKVGVYQGYPRDDVKTPALYVCPPQIQAAEHLIGELADIDEDTVEEDEVEYEVENEGVVNRASLRVIVATPNADVTMGLEAITRWILYASAGAWADTYGIAQAEISATDLDPVFQWLPQNMAYKTVMVSFGFLDSWTHKFQAIADIERFGNFFELGYVQV